MIQRVLASSIGRNEMMPDDLRALTPQIYAHVTPSGTFRLEMSPFLFDVRTLMAAMSSP
jgi:hypothetical protein